MKRILMDYFKRSQSHQCLLMAIIQIDRHIPVINSRHIRVKNTCGKFGELFFVRHPIEESSVTGNTQNFAVQTFDIPSGLGWMYALHRTFGKGIIAKSHVSAFVIIIRNDIRQLGTTVSGSRSTRSGIAHRRIRRFLTTCMIERFTFHIHFRGMRLPIHR